MQFAWANSVIIYRSVTDCTVGTGDAALNASHMVHSPIVNVPYVMNDLFR
jgi:hypothetical protein